MRKIISLILTAAILLTAVSLISCSDKKKDFSDLIVCETEDFEVNASMMSYFFKMQYNSYSSYLTTLGIKSDVSLKEQECPLLRVGTGSWFTYFVELTKGHVTEVLALCQTAHDNGIELDEADRKNIDSYVSSVENAAKSNGYSPDKYVTMIVGNPATIDDIRACLELEVLAEKYSLIYESAMTFTEEELEAYYSAHSDELDIVDVYAFTVTAKTGEEDTVREAMKTITSAKTPAEYKAFVRAYAESTGASATEAETAANNSYFSGASKDNFYYSADWAFSAKAGDTYLEEANGTFTAFMLVKEPYRNESATRSARHILLSNGVYKDSTKAEFLYSEWEKAAFAEGNFVSMAKQYSDDSSTSANGGLLDNIIPGTIVEPMDAWVFDSARNPGDHAIIESGLGWHLVYYIGEGNMPAWAAEANAALATETYNGLVSKFIGIIEYNEDVISKIDG